jgi:S-DNA-T family DNA segregation ATPase FtsK/SpoIIIE
VTPLTYPAHKLNVPLGQSVAGQAIFIDLNELPHLLIAGATGSGKSVCLNALIAGLLCYHTPDTLRLLLLDPKMVELAHYNGIPHLLAPVVTEIEGSTGILAWAVREMERRYQELAKSGSRNIGVHNDKVSQIGGNRLPFILLFIDELADLMLVASDQVEQPIVRLAQKARAVGIHLVVATQRPSTEVITGLFKANFPARVAFAVSSQVDSRVILDRGGAEKLLGQGDMLYQSPRSVRLQRLQGAYVSDEELTSLVKFWQGQVKSSSTPQPGFLPEGQEALGEIGSIGANGQQAEQPAEENLLEQAITLVRAEERASITLLQRKLRIGYTRAAELMAKMEGQGIVGPAQRGNRAREVFCAGERRSRGAGSGGAGEIGWNSSRLKGVEG